MAANLDPALQPLLAEQQGAQVGQGGRAQPMPAEERAVLLDHARHNKPRNVRHPFTAGPEEPDAADRLAQFMRDVMRVLIASNYYLLEREQDALVWLTDQFEGAAAYQWGLVHEAARREPSTTGIGVRSVLYRAMRDMLAAYPIGNAAAELRIREERDFVFDPRRPLSETRLLWTRYFEAYDRGVARTAHLGPTLIVPPQDWPTRLREMQKRFPPWINKLIDEYPANFADPNRAWNYIIDVARREKRGPTAAPAAASGGRPRAVVQQLAEMDHAGVGSDDAVDFQALFHQHYQNFVPSGTATTAHQMPAADAGGLHALRNSGFCWRCGSRDHHRSSCPQPASQNELDGLPLASWMVRPPPSPAPSPSTALAPLSAVQSRLDRQDALLQSILARLDAVPLSIGAAPSSSPALVPLSAPVEPTPPTVATPSAVAVEPPMIVGGPQPAGYVLAGQNQGMPLWVESSLLAASVMHARMDDHSGNAVGSQQ